MPLERRELLHIGILLLSVPLQYILSGQHSLNKDVRQNTFLNFGDTLKSWFDSILKQHEHWTLKLFNVLKWFFREHLTAFDEREESPAVEVLKYNDKKFKEFSKLFKRPNTVKYRIGQVVSYVREDRRGVIIAWNVSKDGQVTYSLLLERTNTGSVEPVSVLQEEILPRKNTEIDNPNLKNYFSKFDGSTYLPLKWLRQKYPRD